MGDVVELHPDPPTLMARLEAAGLMNVLVTAAMADLGPRMVPTFGEWGWAEYWALGRGPDDEWVHAGLLTRPMIPQALETLCRDIIAGDYEHLNALARFRDLVVLFEELPDDTTVVGEVVAELRFDKETSR